MLRRSLSHMNLFIDLQKKDCFITYESVYQFTKSNWFYVIKICQIWKCSYIFKWKFRILDREYSWVNHLCVKSKLIFNVFYCFTNFTGIQPENFLDQECEIFRMVFLYEHKLIEKFQICASVPLSIYDKLIERVKSQK